MFRAVAGIFASVAFAVGAVGGADAQKIPSSEAGIVIFALEPVSAMEAPVEVRKGDVAWTETGRPALVVRLLDDAEERTRPQKADAVPAGTLLFGMRLASGDAYCAPIDPEAANGRVQCFRDLDDDGTFDAGYLTGSRQAGSRYTPGIVRAIMSVPKYRYEKASYRDAEAIELPIVFRGMDDGVPTFRVEFQDNRLVKDSECEPVSDSVCKQIGREIAVSAASDGRTGLQAGERSGAMVLSLQTPNRR